MQSDKLEFACDYCGESVREGERTWSVPITGGARGTLCSPECQLSYSKYILDPYHARREHAIRAQHGNNVWPYAPPPARVKRYNPVSYTPREQWLCSGK